MTRGMSFHSLFWTLLKLDTSFATFQYIVVEGKRYQYGITYKTHSCDDYVWCPNGRLNLLGGGSNTTTNDFVLAGSKWVPFNSSENQHVEPKKLWFVDVFLFQGSFFALHVSFWEWNSIWDCSPVFLEIPHPQNWPHRCITWRYHAIS